MQALAFMKHCWKVNDSDLETKNAYVCKKQVTGTEELLLCIEISYSILNAVTLKTKKIVS